MPWEPLEPLDALVVLVLESSNDRVANGKARTEMVRLFCDGEIRRDTHIKDVHRTHLPITKQ